MRPFSPSYGIKDALFLAIVFFTICLVATFFALHQDHQAYSAYCAAADHAKEEGCKIDKPFMEKLIGDPAALFTAVLAVLTFILASVGVGQVYFLFRADETARRSADAAKQSADIARETLIASNRAWIKVGLPVITAPLTVREDGDVFAGFRVPIENIGKEIASDVIVNIWIDFFSDSGINIPRLRIATAYFRAKRIETDLYLFPGDRDGFGETDAAHPANGPAVLARSNLTAHLGEPVLRPVLFGCVGYNSPSSRDTRHQTRFGYEIEVIGGLRLEPREVSPNAIRLRPFTFQSIFGAD